MSLTCGWPDYDDCSYYFEPASDYSIMPERKRRIRCASCNCIIDAGSCVTKHNAGRPPKNDIEERIYGDEPMAMPMASKYFCEHCSDIYFNLYALGYGFQMGDNMNDLLRDYIEERNFLKRENVR